MNWLDAAAPAPAPDARSAAVEAAKSRIAERFASFDDSISAVRARDQLPDWSVPSGNGGRWGIHRAGSTWDPLRFLRDEVGNALEEFFTQPYQLWFIAEEPVRNDTLPANIAQAARTIIAAAEREGADTLQEQIDYALSLVAWSCVAQRCGVQLEPLDVLVDAGGSTDGVPENALVNGHVDAARHLIDRGAALTLSTALLLERWEGCRQIGAHSTSSGKAERLSPRHPQRQNRTRYPY